MSMNKRFASSFHAVELKNLRNVFTVTFHLCYMIINNNSSFGKMFKINETL